MNKAYYIVKIKDQPKHIRYRYSAEIIEDNVKSLTLEMVTKIEDEYVAFKKVFSVHTDQLETADSEIKEHFNLFSELLSLKPKELVLA